MPKPIKEKSNYPAQETTSCFWLVCQVDALGHTTAESAKDEASRLAEQHPNSRFAVMQSMEVMVATINPVQALRCVTDK